MCCAACEVQRRTESDASRDSAAPCGARWQVSRRGTWIKPARRYAIYHRDSFRCAWCECDLSDSHGITLDHVAAGSNDSSNLVTCCMMCNSLRGNTTFYEMLQLIPKDQGDAIVARLNQPLDVAAGVALSQKSARVKRGPLWYSRFLMMQADTVCDE